MNKRGYCISLTRVDSHEKMVDSQTMFRSAKEYFKTRIHVNETSPSLKQIQLATAAILIEVSSSDNKVALEEHEAICDALQASFGIDASATRELVQLAEKQVQSAISVYDFTLLVDKSFSPEQKKHIIGLAWQVAFADQRLDEKEEYLLRKLATLLHVPHHDFIEEKLHAKVIVESEDI